MPTLEHDLVGCGRDAVLSVLRTALEGNIKVVGHNLKYDYVLLRRNGIRIANIEFDTMLAAYDCFGDSDLNLPYLAKRLLGKSIRAHKDIVRADHGLLAMPLGEVVDYSCEHAEVTLQLRGILQEHLSQLGIEQQYRNDTLALVKLSGDWECDGIPVDCSKLERIREALKSEVLRTKELVIAEFRHDFNLDSEKEVAAVLRLDPILAKLIGFRKLKPRLLEEVAIANKGARLLVRYQRCKKRLRGVEMVAEAVRDSRVHPVFSQTRTDHGRLYSVNPRLLDLDNIQDVRLCLPEGLQRFCPDANKALGALADVTADYALRSDLLTARGSCCFHYLSPLNDGNHLQLLGSIVVGVPDDELCRLFLLDRTSVAAVRHEFKIRYSATWLWLRQFCEETATNGFAAAAGRRRYFEGLRSSNLAKRDKAMNSAVKWLIAW